MHRLILLVTLVIAACAKSPAPVAPSPAAPATATPAPAPASTPTLAPLDEAAVKAKSHAFFEAFDRHDAAALDALGPSFVWFVSERFLGPPMVQKMIKNRHDHNAAPNTRTWKDEQVFVSATSAVFIGEAVVHLPADGEFKAEDRDGWHTLLWVPDGKTWKIAHYQWQKGGLDVERDVWNERYRTPTGFKLTPNQLLVDTVKGRKPGTALDIAMGQGRNALYLAAQKWKVTGIDISDVGIKVALETAAKQKLKLETVEADLHQWDLGKDKWDLVTLIYAGDSTELAERIKVSLKKGGLVIVEYFHADSDMAKMGVGGWKTGQLAEIFKPGFKILRDDVVEDTADWSLSKQKLVRFVAQKL